MHRWHRQSHELTAEGRTVLLECDGGIPMSRASDLGCLACFPPVAPSPPLTRAQGYARYLLIPVTGDAGQRRLLAARVCVMGAGGLGSPALLYLAAAGVCSLTIVDDDAVDLTNLQRQIIQ